VNTKEIRFAELSLIAQYPAVVMLLLVIAATSAAFLVQLAPQSHITAILQLFILAGLLFTSMIGFSTYISFSLLKMNKGRKAVTFSFGFRVFMFLTGLTALMISIYLFRFDIMDFTGFKQKFALFVFFLACLVYSISVSFSASKILFEAESNSQYKFFTFFTVFLSFYFPAIGVFFIASRLKKLLTSEGFVRTGKPELASGS
jgi:hypothetical protein